MQIPNLTSLRQQLDRTVGPAPWYWKTFPAFRSVAGQRYVWTHHGEQGPVAYLVSLTLEQEPDKPRLALNTYCRPFHVPPHSLGVWCPEGRSIRLACFDPDQLKAFDLAEVAGWFKQSTDRIYAATAPIAELEVTVTLGAGTHKITVPPEMARVDEIIVPTSYKAMSNDDPAFALFVFYLQAGLVEVLPRNRPAVDFARRARSGIASHLRRVFRCRNVFARRRWLPAGGVGRASGWLELTALATRDHGEVGFTLRRDSGVLLLTLTSRDGMNRLTRGKVNALCREIERVMRTDAPAHPMVISGALNFSAGADLNEIAQLRGPDALAFADAGQKLMNLVEQFPAPVFAAISGYCMGGGLDLALACHRRIAAPNAIFGHRGAALGLITGWGGTQRLPRLIGKARALEMFVAAEKIHALRGLQVGLVDAVVEGPLAYILQQLALRVSGFPC